MSCMLYLNFTSLEDRPTQREKAFQIYQKFLAPGGTFELNIDETMRAHVFSVLSSSDWNKTLFAECQYEVTTLLESVRNCRLYV